MSEQGKHNLSNSGFMSLVQGFSSIEVDPSADEPVLVENKENKFDAMAKLVGKVNLVKPKKRYEEKNNEFTIPALEGPAYRAGIPKHSRYSYDEWMHASKQTGGGLVFEYWADSKSILVGFKRNQLPGDMDFFFDRTLLIKSGIRSEWEREGYKACLLVCSGTRLLAAIDPSNDKSLLYSGSLIEINFGKEKPVSLSEMIEHQIPN